MKILLLAPGYGSGHLVAMQGIKDALTQKGLTFTEIDTVATGGLLEQFSSKFFAFITRKAPSLWVLFYPNKLTATPPFRQMYRLLYQTKFRKQIAAIAPDIIICNQFSTTLISSLYKEKQPQTKVYAFITDYDAYPIMVWPSIDCYFASSQKVKEQLVSFGVPDEQVVVSGIPLRQNFWQASDKKAARIQMGIDPDSKVILFALGTYASVPVADVIKALKHEVFFPIVLAGKKQSDIDNFNALFVELKKPGRVFPYTNDIAAIMAASDLYVTKAGGITVSESLACSLPCVFFKSVAGQESANMRYVVDAQAGMVANTMDEVVAAVKSLLDSPDKLTHMQEQARSLAKPQAAQTIVNHIFGA